MYSRAAAICLATRFEWSSPIPLSETFDVKSPGGHKPKTHNRNMFTLKIRFLWIIILKFIFTSYLVARILVWKHKNQMSQKPHHRLKRCFYAHPSTIPDEIHGRNPELKRKASARLQERIWHQWTFTPSKNHKPSVECNSYYSRGTITKLLTWHLPQQLAQSLHRACSDHHVFAYNSTFFLPLSTISVSVALCSTSKILPNHPSPTIDKTSNSSIKCTLGNKECRAKRKEEKEKQAE